jgi:hypothetical protein
MVLEACTQAEAEILVGPAISYHFLNDLLFHGVAFAELPCMAELVFFLSAT